LTPDRRAEIEQIARQLHETSENYQLAHAILGANNYLKQQTSIENEKLREDEKQLRLAALRRDDNSATRKADELKVCLQKAYNVRVEYGSWSVKSARVLKKEGYYKLQYQKICAILV